jgi:polyphenol oxidase
MVRQIHSRRVVVAPEMSADTGTDQEITIVADADGLVGTGRSGTMAVSVADCMPICLYHPHSGVRGILHSGWKGTGILENALKTMTSRWGIPSCEIRVLLGPCIGPCCYRVDEQRAGVMYNEFGASAIREDSCGVSLDLRGANQEILKRYGVSYVTDIDLCTSCDLRFGSFRREGPENFSRMIVIVSDEQ